MSPQDCLTAACMEAMGAAVLTYDRHFDHIPAIMVLRPVGELRGW